jgi:hypothetical protein
MRTADGTVPRALGSLSAAQALLKFVMICTVGDALAERHFVYVERVTPLTAGANCVAMSWGKLVMDTADLLPGIGCSVPTSDVLHLRPERTTFPAACSSRRTCTSRTNFRSSGRGPHYPWPIARRTVHTEATPKRRGLRCHRTQAIAAAPRDMDLPWNSIYFITSATVRDGGHFPGGRSAKHTRSPGTSVVRYSGNRWYARSINAT